MLGRHDNGEFYEWLRQQNSRTDGVGDFARFILWDREAPKESDDPERWTEFCRNRKLPFLVASFTQSWIEFKHVTKKDVF